MSKSHNEKQVVLVVEDEPLILMNAVDIVEDAGFEAVAAVNADEAIGILESRDDICVMFTDVDMPGSMDGLALSQSVSDRWPPVKVLVTSGYTTVNPRDLPIGGFFIKKPYLPSQIAAALRDFTR